MANVTFTCNGEQSPNKTVEMKPGAKLWEATSEGIQFVEPGNCGGKGRCQVCKCRIDGRDQLSCQVTVGKDDMNVEVMTYYND